MRNDGIEKEEEETEEMGGLSFISKPIRIYEGTKEITWREDARAQADVYNVDRAQAQTRRETTRTRAHTRPNAHRQTYARTQKHARTLARASGGQSHFVYACKQAHKDKCKEPEKRRAKRRDRRPSNDWTHRQPRPAKQKVARRQVKRNHLGPQSSGDAAGARSETLHRWLGVTYPRRIRELATVGNAIALRKERRGKLLRGVSGPAETCCCCCYPVNLTSPISLSFSRSPVFQERPREPGNDVVSIGRFE